MLIGSCQVPAPSPRCFDGARVQSCPVLAQLPLRRLDGSYRRVPHCARRGNPRLSSGAGIGIGIWSRARTSFSTELEAEEEEEENEIALGRIGI